MIKELIESLLKNIFNVFKEKLFVVKGYVLITLRRIFNKPQISYRLQLPLLINWCGLNGVGAEIGVLEGEFSEHILKYSHLSILYSIDPYKNFEKSIYNDPLNITQDEFKRVYKLTCQRLGKYKNRSSVLRLESYEASKTFKDESIDFIYIDANHSYEACKKDIECWWPKLKKGGIFAGHDYWIRENFGVIKAVDEFCRANNQRLFVTFEETPSWYLVKTK